MSSNPWFRLYSEFANDPKVQIMSETMQRRYIMLLCLRCSDTLVTLHETEIAFHLRISDADLAETKALFIEKSFIDEDWNVLNWDKRQFKSDSSAERVARHRERIKASRVTLQKQKANVVDTDTDTDTERTKPPIPPLPKKQVTPKPKIELPAWLSADLWKSFVEYRNKIKCPLTAHAEKLAIGTLEKLMNQGEDIEGVINQTILSGKWTGFYPVRDQAGTASARPISNSIITKREAKYHEISSGTSKVRAQATSRPDADNGNPIIEGFAARVD